MVALLRGPAFCIRGLQLGKNPAFQFYPSDWIRDPQLRQATFQARGIWIDLLCYMWWSESKGEISGTKESLSRLVGCTTEQFDAFLSETKMHKFGDLIIADGLITLKNRRMIKDEKTREQGRLRQRKYKEKQDGDGDITVVKQDPPLSSGVGEGLKELKDLESNKKDSRFKVPSVDEIQQYGEESGHRIDVGAFRDFYESKGWMVGKNKMKDWKAAVRNWERGNQEQQKKEPQAGYHGEAKLFEGERSFEIPDDILKDIKKIGGPEDPEADHGQD